MLRWAEPYEKYIDGAKAARFCSKALPKSERRKEIMTIYDELKARGLIAQVTDEERD